MKRFVCGILCGIIVFCTIFFCKQPAQAATSGKTGDCTWVLNGTVLVIAGDGLMDSYSSDVSINSTTAPWGNEITKVVIEEGVRNIGNCAFWGCKKLQSVSIPSSVSRIEYEAFRRSGLVFIDIPEGVTFIGEGAFEHCTSLSKVNLPNSLKHIGRYTFQSCPLTSVVFSDKLEYIGTFAFRYTDIEDIWYLGSQDDKDKITIESFVGLLGTWHYESCPVGAPHSYDNICDPNCNGCNKLRAVPDHAYDNPCDEICNNCNKVREIEHQYDDICDEICNVCQKDRLVEHFYDDGEITRKATCNVLGEKTYTCTKCGKTRTVDIQKTDDHKYGNWVKASDIQHKQICSICKEERVVDHTWDSGCVTRKATCKGSGLKTYICTGCLETKTEEILKLTIHTYDNNCDIDCNVCGLKRYITHSYKETLSKDKNGHWYECSVCGEKKKEDAHVPSAGATESQAQICTVCGYIINPVLGHKHRYSEEWLVDRQGHWHSCSGCEEKNSYSVHDFENACDTSCSVCDFTRETMHAFGFQIVLIIGMSVSDAE